MIAIIAAMLASPAPDTLVVQDVTLVDVGKVADIVLLDANPLDDIRNTRKIHLVIRRGKLVP